MKLYKYTSVDNVVRILTERKIRFTQPAAFNDPFEASPLLISPFDEDEAKAEVEKFASDKGFIENTLASSARKHFDSLPATEKARFGDLRNYISFMEIMMARKGITLSSALRERMTPQYTNQKMIDMTIDFLRLKIGVFSMSSNPASLLMWSHYADAHKGAVIEFNAKHAFFATVWPNFPLAEWKVTYTTQRPRVKIYPNEKDRNAQISMAKALLLTKSSEWMYECEYRILHVLSDEMNTQEKDPSGWEVFKLDFPIEAIDRIILGCRTEDRELRLMNGLREGAVVKLGKACLDTHSFSVHIPD